MLDFAAILRAYKQEDSPLRQVCDCTTRLLRDRLGVPDGLGTPDGLGAPDSLGAPDGLGAPDSLGAPGNPGARGTSDIARYRQDFTYIYGETADDAFADACAVQSFFAVFLRVCVYVSLARATGRTCSGAGENGGAGACGGAGENGGLPYREGLLAGTYFTESGLLRYVDPNDCFRWMYDSCDAEMESGLAALCDAVMPFAAQETDGGEGRVGVSLFLHTFYELLIPRQLRHMLGEYYTPDDIAARTVQRAVAFAADPGGDLAGGHGPDTAADGMRMPDSLTVLDPACGSGTFLHMALRQRLRADAQRFPAEAVLRRACSGVVGFDINPPAVQAAKTNYVLTLLPIFLEARRANPALQISIPVYRADLYGCLSLCEPGFLVLSGTFRADAVVGNPPWINWGNLPQAQKESTRSLWTRYGLFDQRGIARSFSKEDVSVLITYMVIDRFLRDGGILAFVVRAAMFKSARNGAHFRQFRVLDRPFRILRVDDLTLLRPFRGSMNRAAVFFARVGEETQYPVPFYVWKPGENADCRTPGVARPSNAQDPASPWVTMAGEQLAHVQCFLGSNAYKARTGVFTGGANAVYTVRILSASDGCALCENVAERAKRRVESRRCTLENAYLRPYVRGMDVKLWDFTYHAYLLMPHTVETAIRPVPMAQLEREAPRTAAYLQAYRPELDRRRGFAGWERFLQQQDFHALLRIGKYTFSRCKVVWRYIAREFICAVMTEVNDPFLGGVMPVPNEKLMYIATDSEEEAYYLCGMLSSTGVRACVAGFMNPTSISTYVLNQLNLPQFCPDDPIHREISALCREGHERLRRLRRAQTASRRPQAESAGACAVREALWPTARETLCSTAREALPIVKDLCYFTSRDAESDACAHLLAPYIARIDALAERVCAK